MSEAIAYSIGKLTLVLQLLGKLPDPNILKFPSLVLTTAHFRAETLLPK
jgi:hypothetical protein